MLANLRPKNCTPAHAATSPSRDASHTASGIPARGVWPNEDKRGIGDALPWEHIAFIPVPDVAEDNSRRIWDEWDAAVAALDGDAA